MGKHLLTRWQVHGCASFASWLWLLKLAGRLGAGVGGKGATHVVHTTSFGADAALTAPRCDWQCRHCALPAAADEEPEPRRDSSSSIDSEATIYDELSFSRAPRPVASNAAAVAAPTGAVHTPHPAHGLRELCLHCVCMWVDRVEGAVVVLPDGTLLVCVAIISHPPPFPHGDTLPSESSAPIDAVPTSTAAAAPLAPRTPPWHELPMIASVTVTIRDYGEVFLHPAHQAGNQGQVMRLVREHTVALGWRSVRLYTLGGQSAGWVDHYGLDAVNKHLCNPQAMLVTRYFPAPYHYHAPMGYGGPRAVVSVYKKA